MSEPVSKSVLFVCLGNICRSPAAQGVLEKLVARSEFADEIAVDSAGTIGYHSGKPADGRMRHAAQQRDIELVSRSRQVTFDDLHQFDLIIAMDRENLEDLKRICHEPTATLQLLSDYLDDSWPTDVPDPYYGGEEGFEYVLDMIESACPRILAQLVNVS